MSDHQAFWEDHRDDLMDPDFAGEYGEATALIQALDELARDNE
ncbi:MAG: hypothetical protein ABR549_12780 [Mycobacteriales bacterium]